MHLFSHVVADLLDLRAPDMSELLIFDEVQMVMCHEITKHAACDVDSCRHSLSLSLSCTVAPCIAELGESANART